MTDLRALLNNATPAPWRTNSLGNSVLVGKPGGVRAVVSHVPRTPDADLIVALVNTADELLQVVEAARGVLQHGTDEDGREWVAAYPAGVKALDAALARLDAKEQT